MFVVSVLWLVILNHLMIFWNFNSVEKSSKNEINVLVVQTEVIDWVVIVHLHFIHYDRNRFKLWNQIIDRNAVIWSGVQVMNDIFSHVVRYSWKSTVSKENPPNDYQLFWNFFLQKGFMLNSLMWFVRKLLNTACWTDTRCKFAYFLTLLTTIMILNWQIWCPYFR